MRITELYQYQQKQFSAQFKGDGMMDDLDFVPYIPLSEQELKRNLEIMAEGNRLLTRHAKAILGSRKRKVFRLRLIKGDFVDQIPPVDLSKIRAVKEVEWPMLCGFAALVCTHTNYWANRCDSADRATIYKDLYQEANLAVIDAIYGYNGKVKFITYVWHAIQRRLRRRVGEMKLPLVPPSKDGARELVNQFERLNQSLNCPITFDDAVEQMGLTGDETRILERALVRLINESQIMPLRRDDSEHDDLDYTVFDQMDRQNVVQFFVCGNCGHETVEDYVYCPICRKRDTMSLVPTEEHALLLKCIELADLTPFQRDLILTSQEEYHGWRAEVAERHGVTRQACTEALTNAKKKVAEKYRELMEQD